MFYTIFQNVFGNGYFGYTLWANIYPDPGPVAPFVYNTVYTYRFNTIVQMYILFIIIHNYIMYSYIRTCYNCYMKTKKYKRENKIQLKC